LLPLVGHKKIIDLTASDVLAARDAIATGKTAVDEKTRSRGRARVTGGTATASATIKLLGAMLSYAIAHDYLEDNVARRVTTFADNQREIFVAPDEYSRIGTIIRQARAANSINATALDLLVYITLTGDRRGEAQSLETVAVDIERQCRVLERTKTGMSVRPIGAAACNHLRSVNGGEQHFFPSTRGTTAYFVGLPKIWKRVSALAGLPPTLTLHGLRHAFAGWAAELGYTEPTIKALLGHRRAGVTQNYIVRPDRALIKAANDVAGHIARMMAGDTRWPDEVIDGMVEVILEPGLRLRLVNSGCTNNRSLAEEIGAVLNAWLEGETLKAKLALISTDK